MAKFVTVGGMRFQRGKLTPLEELELYKSMNAGPVKCTLPRSKNPRDEPMTYTTRIDWDQGHNWVILMRDGAEIAG